MSGELDLKVDLEEKAEGRNCWALGEVREKNGKEGNALGCWQGRQPGSSSGSPFISVLSRELQMPGLQGCGGLAGL